MENIKEKIQKLLNLATSDNEHEAASALAKATELMNKWNLDKEMVLGQKLERRDIEMPFYKWTDENISLIGILAELCDGFCLYSSGNKKLGRYAMACLSGRPRDLENFGYLFNFLNTKLKKESEKYKLSIRDSGSGRKNNIALKSFRIGFLEKIEEKLESSKKQFFSDNKSLIVIDSEVKRKEAEEYLKDLLNGKIKKMPTKTITINDRHLEAGKSIAEEIDLNIAVNGNRKVHKLEHKN
jgi:hypothetical protein